MALEVRHIKAINGLLKGLTRYEALKRAGYSEVVCRTDPHSVFGRPDVQAEIERRKRKMAERNAVTEDWVIQRLMEIANASVGDLIEIDETGVPKWNWKALTPSMRAAIGNFSVDEYVEGRGDDKALRKKVKIQMHDKLRALEMLGKHLGMFKDKVEVSADQNLINLLNEGRARVAREEE